MYCIGVGRKRVEAGMRLRRGKEPNIKVCEVDTEKVRDSEVIKT